MRALEFGGQVCESSLFGIPIVKATVSGRNLGENLSESKRVVHRCSAFTIPSPASKIVNASARPPRLAGLPTVGTRNYRYTGIS